MIQPADVTLWVAFTAGLLSFFSPCVLPLFPSYVAYITGMSFGQLNEENPGAKVRLLVFLHSLAFVGGFSFVFIMLGGLIGMASASFEGYLRESLGWIQKVGGVFIFLFGLHLSGIFPFSFLLGEKRMHIRTKPAGFIGTFLVGIAFAAGWTPCTGPILAAILTLAAGSGGGVGKGVGLLTVYSAGMGIPFIIAGVLFHGFLEFFNRFKKYIRITEIITGVLLMIVGVLLFFDLLTRWFSPY